MSATRTATAARFTPGVCSGGMLRTSTRPSGNCTSPESCGWSTVMTMYPRLANSSTSAVQSLRSPPDPGENSTTGRPPRRPATGAPSCACVAGHVAASAGMPAACVKCANAPGAIHAATG